MSTILIEVKENGILNPIAIPEGTRLIILDKCNNESMIQRTEYIQENGEIVTDVFCTGQDFTEKEIEEAKESATL